MAQTESKSDPRYDNRGMLYRNNGKKVDIGKCEDGKLLEKQKEKTLPKALRTQALTALTTKFGLVGLVQYAWQAKFDLVQNWQVWFGRHGLAWSFWLSWLGLVWFGKFGLVGLVWFGRFGLEGLFWQVWLGRFGWVGLVWYGWFGMVYWLWFG